MRAPSSSNHAAPRRALALGTLALAALFSTRPLPAQTLTPPAPPGESYSPGFFSSIVKEWTFSGCGTGLLELTSLNPTVSVYGTTLCVGGRVTLGVGPIFPDIGEPLWSELAVSANIVRDPRVARVYADGRVDVSGTRTDATCPTGCAWDTGVGIGSVVFIRPDLIGALWSTELVQLDPSVFSPASIQLHLGHVLLPQWDPFFPGEAHGTVVTAQLTAVPEPATVTLLGVGLTTLALGTWRRRRSR